MKSVINVLGKKKFWIVQTFYFITFGLIALLKFYETLYLKYVIDAYFGYNQSYKNLNFLLTYILIIIAGLFTNYFRILLINVLNKRIYEELSNKIVKKFLNLKWYDVYTSNAADTHKLINNDINILMPMLLSACIFLTLFISSKKFDEVLKAQSRLQRESYIEKESFILNMFKGFKYIYANSLQNKAASDFDIVNKRVNTHSINIAYTVESLYN
ncbi:ABC transporter ATP-binding protein [Treponema sp. OMZ 787]|uniref:ABC transporter transmembrane domain-containing protein n=1 Tax=Treponema sp. OMZ 787 TaxID=2563669 RepID=UPI0020A5A16F|nr:ABC transporter transmembrane domain-containing protein [Treponema sp. OMZ 787]UTC62342.1 ABC transporter ATP-binding protein [Treponema sp. OMZ 787]